MITFYNRGKGGQKKKPKHADVLYDQNTTYHQNVPFNSKTIVMLMQDNDALHCTIPVRV